MPRHDCWHQNTRPFPSPEPALATFERCVDCGVTTMRLLPNRPWNQKGTDQTTRSSKHPKGQRKRKASPSSSGPVRTYFVDPETLK